MQLQKKQHQQNRLQNNIFPFYNKKAWIKSPCFFCGLFNLVFLKGKRAQ